MARGGLHADIHRHGNISFHILILWIFDIRSMSGKAHSMMAFWYPTYGKEKGINIHDNAIFVSSKALKHHFEEHFLYHKEPTQQWGGDPCSGIMQNNGLSFIIFSTFGRRNMQNQCPLDQCKPTTVDWGGWTHRATTLCMPISYMAICTVVLILCTVLPYKAVENLWKRGKGLQT